MPKETSWFLEKPAFAAIDLAMQLLGDHRTASALKTIVDMGDRQHLVGDSLVAWMAVVRLSELVARQESKIASHSGAMTSLLSRLEVAEAKIASLEADRPKSRPTRAEREELGPYPGFKW